MFRSSTLLLSLNKICPLKIMYVVHTKKPFWNCKKIRSEVKRLNWIIVVWIKKLPHHFSFLFLDDGTSSSRRKSTNHHQYNFKRRKNNSNSTTNSNPKAITPSYGRRIKSSWRGGMILKLKMMKNISNAINPERL